MKRSSILIPLYMAVLSYCGLLVVLGPGGFLRMRELETRRSAIQSNLDELKAMNAEYERRMNFLLGDEETILLTARKLGYIQDGEKTMRLGLAREPQIFESKGSFVKYIEPEWSFSFLLPVCALVVFVTVRAIILLLGSDRSEYGVSRRRTV